MRASSRRHESRAGAAALCLAILPACYASSVVAVHERVVVVPEEQLAFRPAALADFDGLFESTRIEGEAAASLRRVWYCFGTDGRYSGAALVDGDDGPAFQTLRGRFRLDSGSLVLDDADPVAAEAATSPTDGRALTTAAFLRIRATTGTLVLRKVAPQ